MSKRKWLVLALAVMMLVGLMGGMAVAGEENNGEGIFVEGIFGINRNTADVWKLNPVTGDVEFLFDTGLDGSNVGPNGLAYDEQNGLFYYVTYRGPAVLYVYDGVNVTELYTLGDSIANACFYDGKYYYIAGGTDNLKEVVFDGDGEVDVVNVYPDISGTDNYSWTFNGDIAISEEGLIYGFGLSGGDYQFFTVERDGTNFNFISDDYSFSLQLAFTAEGALIGHDAQQGKNYEIDMTDGSLSLLSTTAAGKLFTDLAQGVLEEEPPVVVCETAWAYGEDIASPNNGVDYDGAMNPSNAWGWTNLIDLGDYEGPVELDLYVGAAQNDLDKGTWVGTVTVVFDDGNLIVTYELGEGFEDCWFSEMHLWVGETELPIREVGRDKTLTPTSAPGQFNYTDMADHPFEVDVSGLDEVWVAAHAVVCCYE